MGEALDIQMHEVGVKGKPSLLHMRKEFAPQGIHMLFPWGLTVRLDEVHKMIHLLQRREVFQSPSAAMTQVRSNVAECSKENVLLSF